MQIYQFPQLGEASSSDVIPISHSNNVYKMRYDTLVGAIGSTTAAVKHGALASCDLDDLTDPGLYALQGGTTYTNAPDGVSFGLLQVSTAYSSTTGSIVQQLTTSGAVTYIRFYGSSAWTDWMPIWKKSQEDLTTYKGIALRVYNRGGQITLRGTSDGTTEDMTTDGAVEEIGTLPSGYRPAVTMYFYAIINATTRVQIAITSAGVIQMGRARLSNGSSTDIASGSYVRFMVSFPGA